MDDAYHAKWWLVFYRKFIIFDKVSLIMFFVKVYVYLYKPLIQRKCILTRAVYPNQNKEVNVVPENPPLETRSVSQTQCLCTHQTQHKQTLTCTIFRPTKRNPRCSKRLMIWPIRRLWTPSGLMATKVRSFTPGMSALRFTSLIVCLGMAYTILNNIW